MANTILTPSVIAKETLMALENNLTFAKQINRKYDDMFARTGAKVGAVINIRKPVRFTVSSGAALSLQDVTEQQVGLTIDQQKHVDFTFSSVELTLSVDEFRERYLQKAGAALANDVDRYMLNLAYQSTYNAVGTPATVPANEVPYLDAGVKMDNEATPRDGNRSVVVTSQMQATMVSSQKGLFQSAEKISDQYATGNMGTAYGFKWSMDQNVVTHTVGPLGGSPLTAGVTASGATTVATDGWTAAAAARLKKGDVITFAGVFAVNPQHRGSTGQLRQFVVTADVSSDGAGLASIPVSPAIVATGAYQNVTNVPADNSAVTVLGAANAVTPQAIAFHKDAFTLATVDLEDVSTYGAWGAVVSSKKLGISMRVARQYNISSDTVPCRVDILYGGAALYPELACRIAS